jgi:hypothetical protein
MYVNRLSMRLSSAQQGPLRVADMASFDAQRCKAVCVTAWCLNLAIHTPSRLDFFCLTPGVCSALPCPTGRSLHALQCGGGSVLRLGGLRHGRTPPRW